MALSKVALSMGRISKLLPGNQGKSIIGSGCIVDLSPNGDQTMISLITTSQVITKNELLSSDPSIVVEFLDKGNWKPITANPCFTSVADIPGTLPVRNLEGTGDACKEISFLVIPIENLIVQGKRVGKFFDSFRKWWGTSTSFEKRALPCNRQDVKTLQAAISAREILCHVMWGTKTDFNTEPHCIEYVGEEREFALTPPFDNNRGDYAYHRLNDFLRDGRPKGAALLNTKGEFVGMLAFEASEIKRLLPLFLPTVDMQASQHYSKESFNSYHFVVPVEIKVAPEATNTCGIDHTEVNPGEAEEGNEATSNNNSNVTHEYARPENGCTNSVVQGSGTSATNPKKREKMSLEDNSSSFHRHEKSSTGESNSSGDPTPGASCLKNLPKTTQTPSGIDPLPCQQPHLQPVSEQSSNEEKSASKDEENEVSYTSKMSSDESAPGEDFPVIGSDESASEDDCSRVILSKKLLQPSVSDEVDPGRRGNQETMGDDQSYFQTDSLSRHDDNIPAQQSFRPGFLAQNSCHDGAYGSIDEEYRVGIGETASPKPYEPPTHTLRESTVQILSNRASDVSREERHSFAQDNVNPGSFVKDVIVNNAKAMDIICLYLDRSVSPGCRGVPLPEGWEHLADKFNLPDSEKKKCRNFSTRSPSESMFEYLRINEESLLITAIKRKLESLDRNDVVVELNKNSSLSEDEATVTDLWKNQLNTLFTVCLMLDDRRRHNTWINLGVELGIPVATLRNFGRGHFDDSPSTIVLEIIKSSQPKLSVADMVAALTAVDFKQKAVATEISKLPEGSTITTLLDNMEVLENVTALLDLRESLWFRFGRKFGVERMKLESLKPSRSSPTEELITFLVQRDPNLTMKSFIEALEGIKRNDLIEELKKMFRFSWCDS